LSNKINNKKETEIRVSLDGKKFTQDDYNLIKQLPEIIKDSGGEGVFELGNLEIIITNMNEYQNNLINL